MRIVLVFCAAFALAQWWGWLRAAGVATLQGRLRAPSAWFVTHTAVELLVAALAFSAALAAARGWRARLSWPRAATALLAGAVAATFTVGTYASVPQLLDAPGQRLLDLTAVAVAALLLGALQARWR